MRLRSGFPVKGSSWRDVLVMPLNDGENLHTLIRRDGPLPPDEVARLGAAIAAAHAAGIIHRDIKPANLLLSADRRDSRIADFGLAHIADDPAHTHAAILAGTPHFLSPEQATGQPADARSDLFSLGATLYFLATGQLPFPGEQTTGVLHAVAHQPHVPARRAVRTLPAWLSALLDALLAKNPAHRPASAAVVADALRRRSPRWSRRRRLRIAARVALLLLAAAAVAFAATRWRAQQHAAWVFAATHPFRVTGSADARYATLAKALAAAKDGDLVLMEKGGAFTLPTQHFGARRLTLRALPHVGATLLPARREQVLFTIGSRLRLENLAIEHPPGFIVGAPLFVAEAGAEISFERCRVAPPRPVRRGETYAESNAPLLRLGAGAKATFERTLVVAHRRTLAQFLPAPAGAAAELRVSDSALVINALLLHNERDAAGRLELRQSTVTSAAVLVIGPRSLPVQIRGDRCFVDCMRSLVLAPELDESEVRRVLTWSGDDNAFHCEGAPLSFLPGTTDRTVFVPAKRPVLDEWRALFPGTELRSVATAESLIARIARNRPSPEPVKAADFTLPAELHRLAPNVGADVQKVGPE